MSQCGEKSPSRARPLGFWLDLMFHGYVVASSMDQALVIVNIYALRSLERRRFIVLGACPHMQGRIFVRWH